MNARIALGLVCFALLGCTPFLQTTTEATTVGITINHQKALDFIFNLFSQKEEASTFVK